MNCSAHDDVSFGGKNHTRFEFANKKERLIAKSVERNTEFQRPFKETPSFSKDIRLSENRSPSNQTTKRARVSETFEVDEEMIAEKPNNSPGECGFFTAGKKKKRMSINKEALERA